MASEGKFRGGHVRKWPIVQFGCVEGLSDHALIPPRRSDYAASA